jgi:hypothetical protein
MKIVRREDKQFSFTSSSGDSAIRADSIGILRVNGDAPIWWIVADEYSEMWTAEGGEELVRPEEDRGRAVLESFKTTSSGRALSQITYGEVPEGFRQITPEHGPPPALELGVRYTLHFLGGDMGTLEFDF